MRHLVASSPAEKCGKISRFDTLIRINRVSVLGWSLEKIVSALDGPVGATVILTFEKQGSKFVLDVELVNELVVKMDPLVAPVRLSLVLFFSSSFCHHLFFSIFHQYR